MNILSKPIKLFLLCNTLICFLLIGQPAFSQQTLQDYSLLPETLDIVNNSAPNILVIFDNSTSMNRSISGGSLSGGAEHPDSRSYVAREAMQTVFDDLEGTVNLGLMVYQTEISSYNPGYTGDTNPLEGGGTLVQRVSPLTGTHLSNIKANLLTEDNSDAQIVRSVDHTAMEGSLRHAHDYFKGSGNFPNTVTGTSDDLTYLLNQTGLSNGDIFVDPLACTEPPVVILVTDGQASSHPAYDPHDDACGGGSTNSATDRQCSREAAYEMHNDDPDYKIRTFVIGFADPSLTANLDALAEDGGTEKSFFASNGDDLVKAFSTIVDSIIAESGSSSGISVVSSSSEATGSVAYSLYKPAIEDPLDPTNKVYWTGLFNSYFIDQFGFLRENSTSNDSANEMVLGGDFSVEPAVKIFYDETEERVRIKRFTDSSDVRPDQNFTVDEIESLAAMWKADRVLSDQAQTSGGINVFSQLQRSYSDLASPGNGYRHILTWLPDNPSEQTDNNVDDDTFTGTTLDFIYTGSVNTPNAINDDYFKLLQMLDLEADIGATDTFVSELENANDIVDFIRGEEGINIDIRNRTLGTTAYLLGDLVHSTPAQVGPPSFQYDTIYADSSYEDYKTAYDDRRHMVYAGSNGGMLHAFNGGFFAEREFDSSTNSVSDASFKKSVNGKVAHEFGAELWAYVPMNLLPHLKFLASQEYTSNLHVSFVDGPVQQFDVRAWPYSGDSAGSSGDDGVHTNGWGTIIVAGMHLGGNSYNVDIVNKSGTTLPLETHSAYVVMDVTDPEVAPTLLAEISHPRMGLTFSKPTVIREGNDWFLMMGSGPNDLQTATSSRTARLFKYQLNSGSRGFASGFSGGTNLGSGASNGFVGHLAKIDWDSNETDDAVYFGIARSTGADLTRGELDNDERGGLVTDGDLRRYTTSDGVVARFFNPNRPVVQAPLLLSHLNKSWVFFGTGVYIAPEDNGNNRNNSFYGIYESESSVSLPLANSNLYNVTNTNVSAPDSNGNNGGDLTGGSLITFDATSGDSEFTQFKEHILNNTDSKYGWRFRLSNLGDSPAIKSAASPIAYTPQDLVFYSGFEPEAIATDDECKPPLGESTLFGIDLVTGTASFRSGTDADGDSFSGPFGPDADNSNNISRSSSDVVVGNLHQLTLLDVEDPDGGTDTINIKGSSGTGEVVDFYPSLFLPGPGLDGRRSWIELEIQ